MTASSGTIRPSIKLSGRQGEPQTPRACPTVRTRSGWSGRRSSPANCGAEAELRRRDVHAGAPDAADWFASNRHCLLRTEGRDLEPTADTGSWDARPFVGNRHAAGARGSARCGGASQIGDGRTQDHWLTAGGCGGHVRLHRDQAGAGLRRPRVPRPPACLGTAPRCGRSLRRPCRDVGAGGVEEP